MKKVVSSLGLAMWLVLGFSGGGIASETHHGEDVQAVHGSVLLGQRHLYMYHIADHAPHDYQAIFEITLDPASKARFDAQRARHPASTTYTIEPEPFNLPHMARHPRPFKANLYRGNFTNQKGGKKIKHDATVTIKRTVYFRKLDSGEARRNDTMLILWGRDGEYYTAHYLAAQPDFDQITQVTPAQGPGLTGNGKAFVLVKANEEANIPASISGNVIGVADQEDRLHPVLLERQIYLELDYINKYYNLGNRKAGKPVQRDGGFQSCQRRFKSDPLPKESMK